ncbi:MAG TPA: DMT family transporter [Tissierellaceae bacterium]|nr:DMT family transporter [Tissierellaceae bacterium]
MKDRLVGTLSIVIAAVIFGIMPLFAKIIFSNGGDPVSLVFYRFFVPIPVLYFINKKRQIDLTISWKEVLRLIVLSLFGISASLILLYYSYNYISIGLATAIFYIYPIFVAIGCVLFFEHKMTPGEVLSVILCGLGMFLFLDNIGKVNIIGILLSFLSGICYAFYIVYFDKSSLRTMDIYKTTYYLCIVSSGLLFIYSLAMDTLVIKLSPLCWFLLIFVSLIVTIVAVTLFQYGIKLIGSQKASIMGTFEPITSVILGVSILEESFNVRTLLGFVIILTSVVLSQYSGKVT